MVASTEKKLTLILSEKETEALLYVFGQYPADYKFKNFAITMAQQIEETLEDK